MTRHMIGIVFLGLMAAADAAPAQESHAERWTMVEETAKAYGQAPFKSAINLTGCWSSNTDAIAMHHNGNQLSLTQPEVLPNGKRYQRRFTGTFINGDARLAYTWTHQYLGLSFLDKQSGDRSKIIKMFTPLINKKAVKSFFFLRPFSTVDEVTARPLLRGWYLHSNIWYEFVYKKPKTKGFHTAYPIKTISPIKDPTYRGADHRMIQIYSGGPSIDAIAITASDYMTRLTKISPGDRFWIVAKSQRSCPDLRETVDVTVYPRGKKAGGITVTLPGGKVNATISVTGAPSADITISTSPAPEN
jgi:hypothetical protein